MKPYRAAAVTMGPNVAEIMMPALSSTMTEGKISQWLMNEGDKVSVGDMVLVVESDKADMDVESYEEGYLAAILTPEGESAAVGAPVRQSLCALALLFGSALRLFRLSARIRRPAAATIR